MKEMSVAIKCYGLGFAEIESYVPQHGFLNYLCYHYMIKMICLAGIMAEVENFDRRIFYPSGT